VGDCPVECPYTSGCGLCFLVNKTHQLESSVVSHHPQKNLLASLNHSFRSKSMIQQVVSK